MTNLQTPQPCPRLNNQVPRLISQFQTRQPSSRFDNQIPDLTTKFKSRWPCSRLNYPVFKSNCNEPNLYHATLVWVNTMRFFSSCSKLPTVLYWVGPIIENKNDQLWTQGWKYAKIWKKMRLFIKITWTFLTLFCAISRQIELESWVWSWIVDNLT